MFKCSTDEGVAPIGRTASRAVRNSNGRDLAVETGTIEHQREVGGARRDEQFSGLRHSGADIESNGGK